MGKNKRAVGLRPGEPEVDLDADLGKKKTPDQIEAEAAADAVATETINGIDAILATLISKDDIAAIKGQNIIAVLVAFDTVKLTMVSLDKNLRTYRERVFVNKNF